MGSLPGDRSLQLGEYFAHPRNRFWKIIAAITGNAVPEAYTEKLELLYGNRTGLWNVLHSAKRIGSLDTAIRNEVPNDLPTFIAHHKNLKVIGFDGLRPAALFDQYFKRTGDFKFIPLPSCSPANARSGLGALIEKWVELLSPLKTSAGHRIKKKNRITF